MREALALGADGQAVADALAVLVRDADLVVDGRVAGGEVGADDAVLARRELDRPMHRRVVDGGALDDVRHDDRGEDPGVLVALLADGLDLVALDLAGASWS